VNEDPLKAFAHRLSPYILDDINWDEHRNGTGGEKP